MTQAIVFTVFGLLFLGLLLYGVLVLARWREPQAAPGPSSSHLQDWLLVHFQPPSVEITKRLFAREDWLFMRGEADPALQAVFLRERRSLALVWIRDVRRAVADIMRFHREIVRHKADLRPGMEMKLIWQYGTFQVMCGVLEFLFRWWDPSRAVAWVGSVRGGLGRVMDSYGEILAAFDPSTLDVLQMDWVRRSSKS